MLLWKFFHNSITTVPCCAYHLFLKENIMKMSRRIATGMVAASLATSLAVAPAQAQSLSHTALATSTGLGSSAVNTVIGVGINVAVAVAVYNFLVQNRIIAPIIR